MTARVQPTTEFYARFVEGKSINERATRMVGNGIRITQNEIGVKVEIMDGPAALAFVNLGPVRIEDNSPFHISFEDFEISAPITYIPATE